MKILLISTFFPYPPDEGIKMPVFNLIKEFNLLGHKIILLSFIKEEEKKYIDILKNFCEKIIVVEHNISKNIVKRILLTLFGSQPYNVYQFYSKKLLRKLKDVLSLEKIDVIFFDFFTTVRYKEKLKTHLPTILHYHDAVSMLFYRNFVLEKNLFAKFYWFIQYKKLLKFENKLQFLFDKITVVAQKDKEWLVEKSNVDPAKVEVIPNGVDVEYFYYKFNTNFVEEPYSLLFRGIMSFKPNIDACLYFLESIYPLLKEELPQVKFFIVGPNPPKKILKYVKNDTSIIITGYVEDIREYIVKCKINISPMISGSGIKNKILESLAMGTPSVVSSIAAEGIPELKDSENILIADTPQEFVEKIKLLFEDEKLYLKLATDGRKLIEEKYTWQKVALQFCETFNEIIKKIS
ncbi:MAG: glycosyltransferase family 4 protein [Endomicrobia bacterium]|nr:glycosyltransferase family 4 protein [Endomicrobiia bacterium]